MPPRCTWDLYPVAASFNFPRSMIQWIYIVGEEFPGQRDDRIDGTIGPRFSLLWCMLLQYVLTKTGQM